MTPGCWGRAMRSRGSIGGSLASQTRILRKCSFVAVAVLLLPAVLCHQVVGVTELLGRLIKPPFDDARDRRTAAVLDNW